MSIDFSNNWVLFSLASSLMTALIIIFRYRNGKLNRHRLALLIGVFSACIAPAFVYLAEQYQSNMLYVWGSIFGMLTVLALYEVVSYLGNRTVNITLRLLFFTISISSCFLVDHVGIIFILIIGYLFCIFISARMAAILFRQFLLKDTRAVRMRWVIGVIYSTCISIYLICVMVETLSPNSVNMTFLAYFPRILPVLGIMFYLRVATWNKVGHFFTFIQLSIIARYIHHHYRRLSVPSKPAEIRLQQDLSVAVYQTTVYLLDVLSRIDDPMNPVLKRIQATSSDYDQFVDECCRLQSVRLLWLS